MPRDDRTAEEKLADELAAELEAEFADHFEGEEKPAETPKAPEPAAPKKEEAKPKPMEVSEAAVA